MSMQVIIDGNNLDNGTWRFITGDFVHSMTLDGGESLVVDCLIEANDASTLATRIASTKQTFRSRGKRIQAQFGGTTVHDFHPGTDEDTIDTATALSDAPEYKKTAYSVAYRLVCAIEVNVPSPIEEANANLEGLETLQVLHTYNAAGRLVTRTLTGAFARNGTGDGRALYVAARDELLTTYLKTAAGGAWDATEKYVLTDEVLDNPDGEDLRIEFTLASQYRAQAWTNAGANVRNATLQVEVGQAPEWHEDEGDPPTMIGVSGRVALLPSAVDASGVAALWSGGIQADVRAEAQRAAGGVDIATRRESYSFDETDCSLVVNCSYQAGSVDVFAYDRTDVIQVDEDLAVFAATNGFHHLQESPTSPDVQHEVTVTRVGVGVVDADTLVPTPTPLVQGRVCKRMTRTGSVRGTIQTEFGDLEYQRETFRFMELRLGAPAPPPSTGASS